MFDLIAARLLSAWHDDHIRSVTTIITLVRSSVDDRFHSSGSAVVQIGWKALDVVSTKKAKGRAESDDSEEGQQLPPDLAEGQAQEIIGVESVAKKTRAPKRFTEGTLLTAMETAGKTLDDKELS